MLFAAVGLLLFLERVSDRQAPGGRGADLGCVQPVGLCIANSFSVEASDHIRRAALSVFWGGRRRRPGDMALILRVSHAVSYRTYPIRNRCISAFHQEFVRRTVDKYSV